MTRLAGNRLTINDLGCCRVVEHVLWGCHVYVGMLFTDAPKEHPVLSGMQAWGFWASNLQNSTEGLRPAATALTLHHYHMNDQLYTGRRRSSILPFSILRDSWYVCEEYCFILVFVSLSWNQILDHHFMAVVLLILLFAFASCFSSIKWCLIDCNYGCLSLLIVGPAECEIFSLYSNLRITVFLMGYMSRESA